MSLLGHEYRDVAIDLDTSACARSWAGHAEPCPPEGRLAPRLRPEGVLDAASSGPLLQRCHRLRCAGHPQVVVDLTGVTQCDRAALDVLSLLTRGVGDLTEFRVEGARWRQFLSALEDAPTDDLQRLCASVDRLLPAAQLTG